MPVRNVFCKFVPSFFNCWLQISFMILYLSSCLSNVASHENPIFNSTKPPYRSPKIRYPLMEWPPIICSSDEHPSSCMIFFHDIGDSGNGTAISSDHGYVRPAWYDKLKDDKEDFDAIVKATTYVHNTIEVQTRKGISSERIVVGGYGQGGALALLAALTYYRKLGAAIAISAYLPLHCIFSEDIISVNKEIPIMQVHGDVDTVVPIEKANKSVALMKTILPNVHYKVYEDTDHEFSSLMVDDLKKFVAEHIPPLNLSRHPK